MNKKILIETSARHLHLSKEHLECLFGEGYKLTPKKDLSQPGQFACEERVEVIGSKGTFNMSVLGPLRNETQIEISLTDARSIGIVAPIRESGDIEGSGACTLKGPKGSVELTKGVIAAKRHIHATPKDAEVLGVEDKDVVTLEITTEERSVIFKDVVIRVNEQYALAAHIDTDEANAVAPSGSTYGTICEYK